MKSLIATLCALLVLSGVAWGAQQASAPLSAASPVVVYNRTLAQLRQPLMGYSAQDRAEAAEKRIARLLETMKAGKVSTAVASAPLAGTYILLDGELMFTLLDGDVDTLSGETMQTAVAEARHQAQLLVADQREIRNPRELIDSVLLGLLFTGLAVAVFWLLLRFRVVFLRLGRRFLVRPVTRLTRSTLGAGFRFFNRMLRWLLNTLFTLASLILFYAWTSSVFALFPFTRVWSEELNSSIFGFLRNFIGTVFSAIPGLLIALFILLVARVFNRFVRFLFDRVEEGEITLPWFDRDTASTTRKIVSFLVWLLAVAMIYPYLPGANTDAFKGLSVMVGLMVSLGATGVVGQFVSGMILIYAKSLKQGEYVRIGDTEGTVVDIGMFATKIHTNLREEVSIPNSVLVSQSVKNYSRLAINSGVISQVTVTIGYDTPWRQVHAMLLEAARNTAGVRQSPAPTVYQTALSDFYAEYNLRVALDEPRRRLEILSDLHAKVQDVFNKYNVQIMSPHYVLDPKEPKVVPPEGWSPAPARKD